MTGLGIRLYLDEDVDVDLAVALKKDTYDVVTCLGEGNANQRKSDEWQLEYATNAGRAILVYNAADYIAINDDWWAQNKPHCGILIAVARWHIGDLIHRTRTFLDTFAPHEITSQVRHL